MCSSGASRQTTSGGLSPSGKVKSLYIRAWGVVLANAMRRKTIPRNPGMLGCGAVAANPGMFLLVHVPCASFGASRRVGVPRAWAGAGGKAGVLRIWDRTGRNVGVPCLLVPVCPAWRACVGARLSWDAGFVLFWGSCRSLSAWTFNIVTYNARALMLSRIWLRSPDSVSGASCPHSLAWNYWSSSSSSPSPLALDSNPDYRSHWDPYSASAALGTSSPP